MDTSRPFNLNEPTWNFLVHKLLSIPQADRPALFSKLGYPQPTKLIASNYLPILAERPAPFLLEMGIFNRPDLLAQTILGDETDTEYILTPATAAQIAKKETPIFLERLYDRQPAEFTLEQITNMFVDSKVFDQLERLDPDRYRPEQLQRILDHYSKGKIEHLEEHRPNFIVWTPQGKFLIHEVAENITRAQTEEINRRLALLFGPLTPLSYFHSSGQGVWSVHQQDRHYVVYALDPVTD